MNNIKKINFHLGENKESFLYLLYEEREFNIKKYNELLYAIKKLNSEKNIYLFLEQRFEDCIGFNFLSNLFGRFHLILNIEGDIREYNEKINITKNELSTYIEELSFELQSLFAGWEKDYHGKKY